MLLFVFDIITSKLTKKGVFLI